MVLPTPVCAFDISPDGVATPCRIADARKDGWRWLHFNMADPALGAWLDDQLPDAAACALQLPETRPRFDELPEGALINLRGVNLNEGADPEDMVALRIWATPELVITLRRRRIMAVDAIRVRAETGAAPATTGGFLVAVADGLTQRIETVSLDLEEQVDDLEEAIFAGEDVDTRSILVLRQTLIKLKRFIGPQREALLVFAGAQSVLMDEKTLPHLTETANRAARTVEALESARDRIGGLQDHLDAKAAAALGRNGYLLSIVAAIFLPLGFLTGLFGVNIAGMPGVDTPWAFAAMSVASVVLGVVLFIVFRIAKWL